MSPLPLLPALLLLAAPADLAWRTLEPGLETTEVRLPIKSDVGDSTITVLRVDPGRFDLSILGVKSRDAADRLPAGTWLKDRGLVAVTNAGMFALADGVSTVGFGRAGSKVLNDRWKPEYGAALVFGPRKPGLPQLQILDRACDDLAKVSADYDYVLQSIRMIDCRGRNSWKARKQRYSSVIAAVDARGRLLVLHCRSPFVMHDYIGQLLALPALGLQRALYLEGGPEASLHVESGDTKIVRVGSYETGFHERDDNRDEWGLPNVIAIRRRAPPATSP